MTTTEELKAIALEVALPLIQDGAMTAQAAITFGPCFLAAVQERAEPVGFIGRDEQLYPKSLYDSLVDAPKGSAGYSLLHELHPLFTHPSFEQRNEPAPQPKDETIMPGRYKGDALDKAVGAAPLPDDVKEMAQQLRNEFATSKRACEAADMIERLAENRVPEGMVLVPREPTDKMCVSVREKMSIGSTVAEHIYKTMLAAGEVKPCF